MANYGYIHVDITRERALEVLTEATTALFGDRLRVRDAGFALLVEAPETGSNDWKEARRLWLATGENGGFAVEVEKGSLGFRHGPGPRWLDWVRGCIEEEVCDRLDSPIIYDANDEAHGPGERRYRTAVSFRGYMTSFFGGKLSAADKRYLAPHFSITPPQFLDGAPPPSREG